MREGIEREQRKGGGSGTCGERRQVVCVCRIRERKRERELIVSISDFPCVWKKESERCSRQKERERGRER